MSGNEPPMFSLKPDAASTSRRSRIAHTGTLQQLFPKRTWDRPPLNTKPVKLESPRPEAKYDVHRYNGIAYDKSALSTHRSAPLTRMAPIPGTDARFAKGALIQRPTTAALNRQTSPLRASPPPSPPLGAPPSPGDVDPELVGLLERAGLGQYVDRLWESGVSDLKSFGDLSAEDLFGGSSGASAAGASPYYPPAAGLLGGVRAGTRDARALLGRRAAVQGRLGARCLLLPSTARSF